MMIWHNLAMATIYGNPSLIREGVYGASFVQNGEPLFLRMELITQENTHGWVKYREWAVWTANKNNGALSALTLLAGQAHCPNYETIKGVMGFTESEVEELKKKAIQLKEKTNGKIVELLNSNSVGTNHMKTGYWPGKSNYIVYITKNPDFSIQDADKNATERTLKKYFEVYKDILISVGSDFTESDYFNNRGISRNPYWVFEEKYAGLSMLLHGFAAKVAKSYFPGKELMHVSPVGSMQMIISKSLLPGEGFIILNREKIDLTEVSTKPESPEFGMNYIQVTALIRIYDETINRFQ